MKGSELLTQSVQDYLKAIYKLEGKGTVSTTELSKELSVSGASVTGMLKRLSKMGLVDYNSYKGVKLTSRGEKVSLEIIRHHRLLELFLKEELGFKLDRVHEEACRLEHVISEEFADKIYDMLGNPKFDPHGHPIPTKEGKMPTLHELPLSEVEPGKKTVIRRLSDTDQKLLGYLEEIGLMPNVKVSVISKSPFNGPISIKHDNEEKVLGYEVAGKIYVELLN
ncbi:MAG: metal-dependent transcriptional regulator [Ignavibacteriae bacterium]|nr:metal-dependent transcriptional regulator [Ignavibacteriota bacterium]